MNITSPLFHGATKIAGISDDSLTSLVRSFGQATGLFGSGPDGELGIVMSGLAGAAAAVAVGIALTVYFHNSHRTVRDLTRHGLPRLGLAAIVTLALTAFVASDMRHAAYAYLGLNSS